MLFSFFPSLPFLTEGVYQNVSPILSIGGWSGSQFFSPAVATDANRTAFAKAILNVTSTYKLDGIEFECVLPSSFKFLFTHRVHSWEYPTRPGIGCNKYSPDDSANFLLFLKTFRKIAPKNLIMTAAVPLNPYLDSTGKSMSNVTEFAKVLDYIGSLFLAFCLSHLFLTVSLRGYELRCLGRFFPHCWT